MKKNDEKILMALLECGSVSSASRQANVSKSTVFRRLSDAEFRAAWRDARESVVEAATGEMQSAMSKAVRCLIDSLEDRDTANRIRAAKIILENSQKGLETFDAIERLERLETMFEAKERR
jgi:molybdenum-dependent DNA-binding transcriptional regulator ModE